MKCYRIAVKGAIRTPIQSVEDLYEELYQIFQDYFGPDVCGSLTFDVEPIDGQVVNPQKRWVKLRRIEEYKDLKECGYNHVVDKLGYALDDLRGCYVDCDDHYHLSIEPSGVEPVTFVHITNHGCLFRDVTAVKVGTDLYLSEEDFSNWNC